MPPAPPFNATSRARMNKICFFWPLLAAVRFFLALIVAGTHLLWFNGADPIGRELALFSGLAAVIGFLVLSGFSIAASHARDGTTFYFRRARRILPLYVLAVVAGSLVPAIFGGNLVSTSGAQFPVPSLTTAVANLFFLQGFIVDPISSNPVLWTLSIEIFFYILAPAINRLSSAALAVMIAASVILFASAWYFQPAFYSELRFGSGAALLAWAWLLGFVAYRIKNRPSAALLVLSACVVALTANPMFQHVRWPITVAIVALALGFGSTIHGSQRLASVLTAFGDASYPLYLFHLPIYILLAGWGISGTTPVYTGLAIVVSFALDRLFDRPIKLAMSRAAGVRRPADGKDQLARQT